MAVEEKHMQNKRTVKFFKQEKENYNLNMKHVNFSNNTNTI